MLQRDPLPEIEMEDSDEIMYSTEDIEEIISLVATDSEDDRGLTSEDDSMEDDSMEDDSPGAAIQIFRGHKKPVFCCSLSKNGELAVTGGQDDIAYVWNTNTGDIVLVCTGHMDSVIFSGFNHNETYLATGDMSGVIKLWRMSDTICVWSYEVSDIIWMTWHHSANVLLAGLVKGQTYMWKLPEGQCKIFEGYGHRAEVGVIFPDGYRLAMGYGDGTLRVLDLKSRAILTTLPASPTLGHFSTITAIDCRADNNLLVSASLDGKTILSTTHNGKIICVLQDINEFVETTNIEEGATSEAETKQERNVDNWVEAAAFCKDPTFPVVATGTIKGELFIWDISRKILRHKVDIVEHNISKVMWKGNTSIIFVAGGIYGLLSCVDAKTGSLLQTFKGHVEHILDLSISEDGKKALTASDDYTARVYDISSIC